MNKRFKSLLTAMLILSVFFSQGAFAAAGTEEDPLISQSYIKSTVIPAAERTISQYAEKYTPGSVVSLPKGSSVRLGEGQYIIMTEGSAQITSISGHVVNTTVGFEANKGTVNRNHRYIACEETEAEITITANSLAYVSGGAGITLAEPEVVITMPFTDVPEGKWFYSPIKSVYAEKIMNGTSATTFNPSGIVTIRTITQLLYNMSGDTVAVSANASWYEAAMKWAYDNGIYRGNAGGSNATRTDLVTLFYNYASYKGKDMSSSGFDINTVSDAGSIPSDSREPFAWAFGNGIISGTSTDTLTANPDGTSTRSQMAAIVVNYITKYGK